MSFSRAGSAGEWLFHSKFGVFHGKFGVFDGRLGGFEYFYSELGCFEVFLMIYLECESILWCIFVSFLSHFCTFLSHFCLIFAHFCSFLAHFLSKFPQVPPILCFKRHDVAQIPHNMALFPTLFAHGRRFGARKHGKMHVKQPDILRFLAVLARIV
jgi:hypothetical protein